MWPQCRKGVGLAFLENLPRKASHSMHPATVKHPKIPIRWITLPSSSVPMLSFAVFGSYQPAHSAASRILRNCAPSTKCFVPYHIHVNQVFSSDYALFCATGIRLLPCFQLLVRSFDVDRGWGVLLP